MSRHSPWMILLLLLTIAGCGDKGPRVVPVTGTLSYKGKVVPNALLNFHPVDGSRPSWAMTDAEGRFKLNYDPERDGGVVGKHKVWIENRAKTPGAVEPGEAPRPSALRDFFEKYSQANSKLEVEIERNPKELTLNLE